MRYVIRCSSLWRPLEVRSCAASVQVLAKSEALDNLGGDMLGVTDSLIHRQVAGEVCFMNAAEGTEEGSKASVSALRRVAVNFPHPVAIIITRPFV